MKMKKLKTVCPFNGYGTYLFIVLLVLLGVAFFGTMIFGCSNFVITQVMIGTFLGTIIFGYIWINAPNSYDRRKIQEAKPPEWNMISDDEIDLVNQNKHFDHGQIAVAVGMAVVILFFCAAEMISPIWILIIAIVLAIAIFVWAFFKNAIERSWINIDYTARIAYIPIDHTYGVKEYHDKGWDIKTYGVYYTNEGKFVVKIDYVNKDNNVTVVQYDGMVTYCKPLYI